MNELTIMNFNGIETVDSRQVADVIGKTHANLMREIHTYCGYLTEINFDLSDFFIENTYQDSTGRTLPCYLLTRKGCEMVANKMTGQKGVTFTAMYINAFHQMEEHIQAHAVTDNSYFAEKQVEIDILKAQTERERVKTEQAKLLFDFAKLDGLSVESKMLLANKAGTLLLGQPVFALPETEMTYSASEVGEMLGVTANKIGRIANANGLKTDEYGITVLDTAPNGKQIPNFRYNQNGIDKLRELLKAG